MRKTPPSTFPKRQLWIWGALLGGCVLLFVLTWRLTSPSEPLSPTHFAKHRKELEALRQLIHEDSAHFQSDLYVDSARGHTGEKLMLPVSRVLLYKPLLQKTGLDAMVSNEDDTKVWFYNFKQNVGYAFIEGKPTTYDFKQADYTMLGKHWFLFRNH